MHWRLEDMYSFSRVKSFCVFKNQRLFVLIFSLFPFKNLDSKYKANWQERAEALLAKIVWENKARLPKGEQLKKSFENHLIIFLYLTQRKIILLGRENEHVLKQPLLWILPVMLHSVKTGGKCTLGQAKAGG